jgi:[ribosomal protein S18]-alanine N-acetyltransferase
MNPAIRKATIEDIDAIYRIELEGQSRWSRSQFADELKLNFSNINVMENGGLIIGFAVVWNVADEIQLNNIGVKKEYRRNGLGTLMLDHIIACTRYAGPPRKIYLEVSVNNASALSFYRKNGFIEMGRRKNYYDSVDAILMERELQA